MRRLLLVVALACWALPASAQTCVTINGVTRCAAPWQIYDTTVRQLSLPVIDLRQTWNAPGVTFTGWKLNITDTNSAAASLLVDLQVGGVSQFSVTKAGVMASGGTSALGTTSTDGFTLQNTTPSTATTTVQMSPRLKWCGSAWNSTAGLSETDCMFAEVLPVTVAGTTTQTWKLGSIINGGAATYPFTVDSTGNTVALGNTTVGSGNSMVWSGRFLLSASSDGNAVLRNGTGSIGVDLKIDALPTISSGTGTGVAVTAGSTPFAGSVNVGTVAPGTVIVINFNGTAFPAAPFCQANDGSTALLVRAQSSATQLTLTSAGFTASDVVTWICVSSK